AAMAVAEREGIPAVVATVFPGMIPSAHTVPGGINVGPWTGAVGRSANRSLWRAASELVGVLFDRKVNAHRRALGLQTAHGALFRLPRSFPMVVMAPEALVRRPPDWPSMVEVTSFVAWDQGRHRPVDAGTEAF